MLIRIDNHPTQPHVSFITSGGVIVNMPATLVVSTEGIIDLDVPTLESISLVDEVTHVGGAA